MGRRRRDEPRLKRSWGGGGGSSPTSAHSEPAGGGCPRPPRGGRRRGGEPTTTPQPTLTLRHSGQTFPQTRPDRTGPNPLPARLRQPPRATAARPTAARLRPSPAPPFPSGGGSVWGPGCEGGGSPGERVRCHVAIGTQTSFPWRGGGLYFVHLGLWRSGEVGWRSPVREETAGGNCQERGRAP